MQQRRQTDPGLERFCVLIKREQLSISAYACQPDSNL